MVSVIVAPFDYEHEHRRKRLSTSTIDSVPERFLRTADNVVLAENLRRMNDPGTLAQFESLQRAEAQTLERQF